LPLDLALLGDRGGAIETARRAMAVGPRVVAAPTKIDAYWIGASAFGACRGRSRRDGGHQGSFQQAHALSAEPGVVRPDARAPAQGRSVSGIPGEPWCRPDDRPDCVAIRGRATASRTERARSQSIGNACRYA
jgi:hypothetical protein